MTHIIHIIIWSIYDLYMIHIWHSYDPYMIHIWSIYDPYMCHIWIMYVSYLCHIWAIYWSYMHHLGHICFIYGSYMGHICIVWVISVSYMHHVGHIWVICVSYMGQQLVMGITDPGDSGPESLSTPMMAYGKPLRNDSCPQLWKPLSQHWGRYRKGPRSQSSAVTIRPVLLVALLKQVKTEGVLNYFLFSVFVTFLNF